MKLKIFKFKKVKSTNDTAIRIIKKTNFKHGMVISEEQINGKGQYGRKWISQKGNLFISFFHDLETINISLSSITTINCLLVKKTLAKYCKKKILFKKPNDLFIDKKKICGILQEIISISGNKFMIIGIGINLIKSPIIKNYPTTNLFEIVNKSINKTTFTNDLKVIFEKNLSRMYKINNKINKN